MATGTWRSQVAATLTVDSGAQAEQKDELLPSKPAWYYEGLEDLDSRVEEFFVGYAHLERSDVVAHIERLRERAYAIHAYPCIGAYRFLHHAIAENPLYTSAVATLKADPSARFLDIGCCLGQELRQLAYEGVPSSQLIGADIVPEFFGIGYQLFNDRDRFQGQLFRADMLDESDAGLNELKGTIDVIFVGAFLHLFPYETQLKLLIRAIKLLKPQPGVKVLGRQNGSRSPGTRSRKSAKDEFFFQHDVGTFQNQFSEAGEATSTRWKVGAEMRDWVEWQHGRDMGVCGKEYNADTVDLRFWAERVE